MGLSAMGGGIRKGSLSCAQHLEKPMNRWRKRSKHTDHLPGGSAAPSRGRRAITAMAATMLLTAAVLAREPGGDGPVGALTALAQDEYHVHLPLSFQSAGLDALPPVEPELSTPTPTTEITSTPVPATATDALPTATDAPPTPTATATAALVCENLIRNNGFESGPVQWTLTVTNQRQDPGRSIQQSSAVPVNAHGGTWLAWLGGANQTFFELTTVTLLPYERADLVSASVRYHVAMITNETSDRRPNDEISVRIEGDRRTLSVPEAGRSEEDLDPNRQWQEITADVTAILAADDAKHFSLEVQTDLEDASWFYFDDVALEACRAAGP